MNQTTIMVMVNVTVLHQEAVVSGEELATTLVYDLNSFFAQQTNLEVGEEVVDIKESTVNLVNVVPTSYYF